VQRLSGGVLRLRTRGSVTAGQAADAVARAWPMPCRKQVRSGGTQFSKILRIFERQPVLLGAVGITIGAGIAASIPTTEARIKFWAKPATSFATWCRRRLPRSGKCLARPWTRRKNKVSPLKGLAKRSEPSAISWAP
jgi:hypothetical protein